MERKKAALVGQPNVGKSAIFNALTGSYAVVSNYPGTTVEVSRGHMKKEGLEFIDTPGLYSIFPITDEERVTMGILGDERPDLILHIIDTKNIERMLVLTLELMKFNIPIILVLNMYDEAEGLGLKVDTAALAKLIGLPVVATVAVTGQGMERLKDTIARVVLNVKGEGPKKLERQEFDIRLVEGWYKEARDLCLPTVKRRERKVLTLSRLDKILVSPFYGSIILVLVLYLGLYKFVGGFGAGTVVDFLEKIFETHLNPYFVSLSNTYIPWVQVRALLVGEYGIITLGVRYAAAIILPIVGLYFLVFAFIEDSGYLPRLSFLLDGIFKKIGLSGKAVIPMVLGLGCDTMATMVTRTLPTRRERFIATLLLSLCIPCSAQLGVILGLLSGTPYVLLSWFLLLVFIFAAVGVVLSKTIPGLKPSFVIEIPPMRVPKIKNVLIKTFARMRWYFFEVVPLFVLASILIWLGELTGLFKIIIDAMGYPLNMMGLPESAAPAFLFGFFRRDYGAAGLYDLHKNGVFTNNQLLIAVVVLTLFLPCITQFLITLKERGLKVGLGISLFVLTFAFATGVALNLLINVLHVVFDGGAL